MTDARLIYVTAGSRDEALALARALVEARLVACANVLPQVDSVYWWDGAVQQESEAVLIAKTRADLVEEVIAAIRRQHSYSCPCIVSLAIEAGNPAFLDWIATETKRP